MMVPKPFNTYLIELPSADVTDFPIGAATIGILGENARIPDVAEASIDELSRGT